MGQRVTHAGLRRQVDHAAETVLEEVQRALARASAADERASKRDASEDKGLAGDAEVAEFTTTTTGN